jgi:hypothetical protein
MDLGRLSSAALFASGIAGVAIADRVAGALDLGPTSPRGTAEARVGLGGTYAALGGWALVRGGPAQTAVGMTWLGAGVTRLATLRFGKHPDPDWTFWAYLAAELGFGTLALRGARIP